MSKEFNIRVQREASFVEVLDCVIVADSAQEALDVANAVGEGRTIEHPTLKRYNVWEREPTSFVVLKLAHVKD